METVFKFRPLLAINEEQERFHSEMCNNKQYKYMGDRTWYRVDDKMKIEQMALEIATLFPHIVFEGFGKYQFDETTLGGDAGLFHFVFNSNDIRQIEIDNECDLVLLTRENFFPEDIPNENCGHDPTWIVREYNEGSGWIK